MQISPTLNQNGPEIDAVRIETGAGFLAAAAHLPQKLPCAAVVCCHGLMSHKESSKYTAVGEIFSRAGLGVIRFDFSGCGESSVKPEGTLVGSRMRDLESVLEYVLAQDWCDGRIGLLGSSFGGYLSLLEADSKRFPVRACACWSTPFDIGRLKADAASLPELSGISNGPSWLGGPESLESLGPVQNVLLIHGRQDELVGWNEAVEIYKRLGDPRQLVLMESAEHRLLDPSWRDTAMRLTLDWFKQHGLG